MPGAAADESIADTTAGRVRGVRIGPLHVFKGIPYGQSPGARRRFMAPEPMAPWVGTRDALRAGPAAPQPVSARSKLLAQSEDCLQLNVWTPGLRGSGRRPMMVWIHGGGFHSGAAATPATDGFQLAARDDLVVISVTHRLGLLGFSYLEHLAGASGYVDAGVAGMLDLVLALRWIRDNAEEFGGDQNCVTVFGYSGGGAKILVLLGMPETEGLFHRAIVQSAGLVCATPGEADRLTDRWLHALGLPPEDFARLLALPAAQLMEAQRAVVTPGAGLPGSASMGPVTGGVHFTAHPLDAIAPVYHREVPLMIGCTRDEVAAFLATRVELDGMTTEDAEAILHPLGRDVTPLWDTYRASQPAATPADVLIRLLSDRMRVHSVKYAERRLAAGCAPVHTYLFAYRPDVDGGGLGACHGLDVPFVFDTVERSPLAGTRPERLPLARTMRAAWAQFARTGDPATVQLPTWPAYAVDQRATMVFDTASQCVDDPEAAGRRAWDEFGQRCPISRWMQQEWPGERTAEEMP